MQCRCMDIINKTVGVFYNLFKTKKKVIYCVYEQAMKRMGALEVPHPLLRRC